MQDPIFIATEKELHHRYFTFLLVLNRYVDENLIGNGIKDLRFLIFDIFKSAHQIGRFLRLYRE